MGGKKKWTKGKVKEKLMNEVMWTKGLQDKLIKEIPKAKLITPAIISKRLKVNGSLAGRASASWRRRATSRSSGTTRPRCRSTPGRSNGGALRGPARRLRGPSLSA